MAVRERAATIAGLDVNLARWRPRPYLRRERAILPDRQDIPGDQGKIQADAERRLWHINSWRAGEGEELWRDGADAYNISDGARPKYQGEGVILTAPSSTTQYSGADAEITVLGLADGKLWGAFGDVTDNRLYQWDPSGLDWGTRWIHAVTGEPTSIAEGHNGKLYIGKSGGSIAEFNYDTPAFAVHVTTGGTVFSAVPTYVTDHNGVLYALNDEDLYTVDKTATDTVTLVADVTSEASAWTIPWAQNRLTSSDVGPVWVQRTENGDTFIHEYNAFTATHSIIGKLWHAFAFPYSIAVGGGFIFVAYRVASAHTEPGKGYVYFQRGGQRGVIGPFRAPSGTTANESLQIAGTLGDDLILHYDDRLWTYNLSFGGLSVAANHVSTGAGECAKVFGNQVFVAGIGASDMVERTDIDAYDTSEGTLDSGRFDMGYPGIDKVLTKIVVTAEPLPANTQIEVAYSIEGAAFVTVSDTWDTDNETSHTFTVSTSGSSVVGKDFEIRLLLNSTDSSATPTVKSVTAEAISAESRTEYQLEIDAGSIGDGDRATAAALDTLATLAATRTLTTFVDPWGTVEEYEAGVSKTVRVLAVEVPEVGAESQAFATVILREE